MPSIVKTSPSAATTFELGRVVGQNAWPGLVLLLEGGLGAGKTVLVQGLGAGLEVREPITSPSYPIVQEYTGRLPLVHIDLYRLDDEAAVAELGFEDYLRPDVVAAVEWPDRAGELAPTDALRLRLLLAEDGGRTIEIEGDPASLARLGLAHYFGDPS